MVMGMMMRWLKHKEFLPFAPTTGSVRVNHESSECVGDSNSMKIEVKDNGDIFAYCHRCGKSGNYATAYFKAVSDEKGCYKHLQKPMHSTERLAGYVRSTSKMSGWSREARRIVLSCGISEREVVANVIKYDKEIDGLYFTVHNGSESCGYILRRFNYQGPKYINDFDDSVTPRFFIRRPIISGSTVVLVEDILSAIKVGRQYPAVALLGTNCDVGTKNWLIKNYKRFIIFLDDDNKIVRRNQRVLKNTFDTMGEAHIITGVGRDPKYLSNSELRDIIK